MVTFKTNHHKLLQNEAYEWGELHIKTSTLKLLSK